MGCKACAAAAAAYQKKKAADYRKDRKIVPVAPTTPKAVPKAVPKPVVPAPRVVPAPTIVVTAVAAPKAVPTPKGPAKKAIRVKPSPQAIALAKQAAKRRKLLEDYKKNKVAHKK